MTELQKKLRDKLKTVSKDKDFDILFSPIYR